MTPSVLSELEESICQLSLTEQLWLIERLAQRIREHMVGRDTLDSQLGAMARDPEVQAELQEINREFAHAESDGLEAV